MTLAAQAKPKDNAFLLSRDKDMCVLYGAQTFVRIEWSGPQRFIYSGCKLLKFQLYFLIQL